MDSSIESNRSTWIGVAVVTLILLLLLAVVVPAINKARAAARRIQSLNNLKQLGLGFHNYHDVHSMFPPGAIVPVERQPQWGWTYSIIPFMEATPLFSLIDEDWAWDDFVNHAHSTTRLEYLLNPSESKTITADGYPLSHYTMNSSVEFRNSSLTLSDFPKGASNTWFSSEIAGKYRPWAEPVHWRELDQPPNSSETSLGRPGGNGVLIGLADGSVRDFGSDTDQQVLKSLSGDLPLPDPKQRQISERREPKAHSASTEFLSLHVDEDRGMAKGWHQPYLQIHIIHGESKRVFAYYSGCSPMTRADLKVAADNYPNIEFAVFWMPITNDSLPELCRFKKLKRLSIGELSLDKAGLKKLRTALPELNQLRTSLPFDLGIDELQAALPGVKVEIN